MHESLLSQADALFSKDPTYTGAKIKGHERTVLVVFHFPKRSAYEHKEDLDRLSKETGWTFTVREAPHYEAVQDAILALLPDSWQLKDSVSLLPHDPTFDVRIQLTNPVDKKDTLPIAQTFLAQTGMVIDIVGFTPKAPVVKAKPRDSYTVAAPTAEEPTVPFNHITQSIRNHFKSLPHQPLKIKKPAPNTLKIHFLSLPLARRYEEDLKTLIHESGWGVEFHPYPDQNRIMALAKQHVPKGYTMVRKPAVFIQEDRVVCKLDRPLADDANAAMCALFQDMTGVTMEYTC